MKTASYTPNLLTLTELFDCRPTLTVLCKQKLIDPHSARLGKLVKDVRDNMYVPFDLLESPPPIREDIRTGFNEQNSRKGKEWR